jgi:hypothetical protein
MNMKKLLALVAVFALVAFAAPAFAANPFVDVPMNHWAYDAVSHLAAKGIIQGYPDGTYRGNQPMTRYEMSMLVARALATVDMEKASKEDVEMLKKLVVEFKDELDALGVRVDALDERVAVLEEGIGGWKFWGELRFDARWADEGDRAYANSDSASGYRHNGENEFDLNRFRLWMSKQIDDKTKFTARLGRSGTSGVNWDRYFATIQMPWDSFLMVGKWNYDWEGEAGLYIDEDAWFSDQTLTGFYWRKNLAKGDITFFATHDDEYAEDKPFQELKDMYNYGARFNFNMNDKFRIAISGLYFDYDNDGTAKLSYSSSGATRWLYEPVKDNVLPSKAVNKKYGTILTSTLPPLSNVNHEIDLLNLDIVSSGMYSGELISHLADGEAVAVKLPVDVAVGKYIIPAGTELKGIARDVDADGLLDLVIENDITVYEQIPAFESKYYDYGTYWADFGITFSPGFEFKGAYYIQDHDGPSGVKHFDDSPDAYKAIIDVSQDTLHFTSLWIEYAKLDPNFHTALQPWSAYGAELTPNLTAPAFWNGKKKK